LVVVESKEWLILVPRDGDDEIASAALKVQIFGFALIGGWCGWTRI
jgi:hypothetical protein